MATQAESVCNRRCGSAPSEWQLNGISTNCKECKNPKAVSLSLAFYIRADGQSLENNA